MPLARLWVHLRTRGPFPTQLGMLFLRNCRSLIFGMRRICFAVLIILCTAMVSPAQVLMTLASFDTINGSLPFSTLAPGLDGNFYGIVSGGGAYSHGAVIRTTPDGALTLLYSFCQGGTCLDGNPGLSGGLVLATDGNFYGTTELGGANCEAAGAPGCGTVFRISPEGTFTTLYSFCSLTKCKDGQNPMGGLIQASDGNFYGTTYHGGKCPLGGTVFKITPQGTLTTIFNFCHPVGSSIGLRPIAPVVQGVDGNLYGTTSQGGLHSGGTVFKVTPGGNLTTLYNFCSSKLPRGPCLDGQSPQAGLIQGTNSSFYGTTESGGNAVPKHCSGCGTIFNITTSGTFTTLYKFCSQANCTDGWGPVAALVQGSDGTLYGTTHVGGNSQCGSAGCGTIFNLTTKGSFTRLYTFCTVAGCLDGADPLGGLIQSAGGDFYGTTYEGGTSGQGTVFKFSLTP